MDDNQTTRSAPAARVRDMLEAAAEARRRGDIAAADAVEMQAVLALRAITAAAAAEARQ